MSADALNGATPKRKTRDRKGRDEQTGELARNIYGQCRVHRSIDVHHVIEDLDEALSDPTSGDPRLFQRGTELVIARGIMTEDAKRFRKLKFAPGSVIVAGLRPATLVPRITEHVDYGRKEKKTVENPDGTSKEVEAWSRDIPTAGVLAAFLGKVYWAHIRPLRGIASTPIIHLDGTIAHEGYDAATQCLVASNVALPAIPSEPDETAGKAALAELLEPFAEFPFESDAERYSPVALALTLLLRPVIRGNVPAFIQTAPQKNCGKSLTIKAAVLLATGNIPAANTWAKAEEEQEKMIGAAADAGSDCLFFDNVHQGAIIGGAPLDKVLTCDGLNSFRVLGLSKNKTLPWLTVVCFTANRARIGGDTDRRAVVSTLLRPDVPPEHFKHDDLLVYVAQERPRLLAAAFTLVRAWLAAGAPRMGIRRIDSFEHWGQTVASMIVWAGGGNVRELVRDVEGTDTDESEYELLHGIHGWLTHHGMRPDVRIKDLVDDIFGGQSKLGHVPFPGAEALKEAMISVGGYSEGKGGDRKLNVDRFGKRLRSMKDVLHSPYRLKKTGETDKSSRWTVVKTTTETAKGHKGVQGDTQLNRGGIPEAVIAGDGSPRIPLIPLTTSDDDETHEQPQPGFADWLSTQGIIPAEDDD